MKVNAVFISWILLFIGVPAIAQDRAIVVDPDGKGDYTTIQAAINSLPDSSANDRTIHIRKGIYREKIYIGKHHVVLEGEDREKTIITGSIASMQYACEHPNDPYTGIVNLDGNDITLLSLTIENTYGKTAPDSIFIDCFNAATKETEKKKLIKSAHQFALRSYKSTRLKVIGCIIIAWGNDTVSPWNGAEGMYYFKNCILKGGTDFYCPRGWAYAENCDFYTIQSSAAAIWHDGSKDRSMKSVLKYCSFQSDKPFILGRYHHEANFYLIGCSFDKNLIDTPIFKAATAKPMFWESHAYYFNCKTEGKKFDWLRDNLDTAPGHPDAKSIDAAWTFDNRWDPERKN